MTKRINKILWNGTEVPKASTQADGLDGLNLGELFIKNDPEEPGVYTRTTDGKVVLLDGGIDKYLHRLFVAIDANGNEIAPNDTTTPIASVRVNYGLWTEQFLSAKGMNSGGGSSEGGATTLGGLRNVAADADSTYDVAKMLVLEAKSNLWTLKNLSDLVGGLDEAELEQYLTNNEYAKKSDIPSLSGYATEQWVLGKGYATTSDLDARIDALVNGAPQAYDTLKEIADVLANNINSIDDILTALGTKVSKDDFNTAIANVNTAIDSLNTELGLKLDAVTFNELFEKVQLEDGTWAIKAKLGLFSDGFISAKGSNVGGTSSEGGAVALYQLNDVLADGMGVSGATDGAVFVYDGKLGKWKGVAQSEIVPNLTGYATESWVLSQGFLTQHQDLSDYAKLTDIPTIPTDDINKGVTAYGWGDHSKVGYLTGITSALVTGALGYTPYDAANFTKANIKSTLGISDWALASSKPSYTTKEVAEDTNLYFTNARAVAALKSITDGLSSSITSNTTKITNLTTKVDDHIAVFNSMFKLVELSDGTMSIQALHGLWSDGFISAKGANSSGGSSSGGGLITSLYRYADLGKTFADTNNDTFNAYTINKINSDLGSRISVLEGKATNVSFTQSLTSGTQIGSISIDGVTKNIYAPTIPTDDINKGVTAYGWGNHASVGYLTSASNLAWGKITGKPTTISGYGITDAITTANIGSQSVANANQLKYTSLTSGEDMNTYYRDTYNGKLLYKSSSIDVANFPFSSGGVLLIKTAGGSYTTQLAFSASAEMAIRRVINTAQTNWRTILHSENYDDYTYSKSSIDTKLSGYLPLSGGTITGNLIVQTHTVTCMLYPSADDIYVLGQNTRRWRDLYTTFINGYTPIHSGNIGSQSVASATKLQTARTIWGQSFNGENDIDGVLKMKNGAGSGVSIADSSGNYVSSLYLSGTNNFYIGDGMGTKGYNTYIRGNAIRLTYGTSNTLGFILNSSGNIGIGISSPSAKVDIEGTLFNRGSHYIYNSADRTDRLCLAWNSGTACVYSIKADGSGYNSLRLGTTADGNRQLYYDSSTGNWGVGTSTPQYKLDVNGTMYGDLKMKTPRAIWGQSFNGTGDVTGTLHITTHSINTDYSEGIRINALNGGYSSIWLNTTNANGYDEGMWGITAISGGNLRFRGGYTSLNDLMVITKSGNVGMGTTNPQYKLDVRGVIYSNTGIFSDGYVSAKGQNTSSDMRLKNVLNDVVLGVKDIANAPSMRFSWKNGGGVDVGSSAQYWQRLLPDAVKERDGMLEMQYANIALLSAIAIAKNVETHEERIARLEKENEELRTKIDMMERRIA